MRLPAPLARAAAFQVTPRAALLLLAPAPLVVLLRGWAATGAGSEIATMPKIARVIQPDPALADAFDAGHARFRAAHVEFYQRTISYRTATAPDGFEVVRQIHRAVGFGVDARRTDCHRAVEIVHRVASGGRSDWNSEV